MTEEKPTDEGINAESDAKAPITGADPQGESEPDAGTKAEQQTAPAPAVSSEASEAETDQAELARAESGPEVLQVRKGMFGVQGTGDTSGYGGLTRTIEFPAPSNPPFGGWWDQVYDDRGFSRGTGSPRQ